MKGIKTRIVSLPAKIYLTLGDKITQERGSFTLASASWVVYTVNGAKGAIMMCSKAGTHIASNSYFGGDPARGYNKAVYLIKNISTEKTDGGVAYYTEDGKWLQKV